MFQIANQNPRIFFSDNEKIAVGVNVKSFDFSKLVNRPAFKATYFNVAKDSYTPLDQHQVEEIWIVLKGEGILNYMGEQYDTQPQDIFYFAPFKSHQIINRKDEEITICSIYW